MDNNKVAKILKELGHPVRLMIVKELVKYGEKGLPVGELQKKLQIPNSTLSHHISLLVSIGMISQTRSGTTLFCVGDSKLIRSVSLFLLEECCKYSDPASL